MECRHPRVRPSNLRGHRPSSAAPSLLHRHIDEILIFKTEFLGRIIRRDALPVNHEANLASLKTQSATVCIHEFTKRSSLLDLELNLAALLILHLQLNVRLDFTAFCSHGAGHDEG